MQHLESSSAAVADLATRWGGEKHENYAAPHLLDPLLSCMVHKMSLGVVGKEAICLAVHLFEFSRNIQSWQCEQKVCLQWELNPVADWRGGGGEGAMPPDPVKISHKKDGSRIRPHRFRVSWLPSHHYPTAGSSTGTCYTTTIFSPMPHRFN